MFAGYVCGVWQVSVLGTCPFSELERAIVAFAYSYTEKHACTHISYLYLHRHMYYVCI